MKKLMYFYLLISLPLHALSSRILITLSSGNTLSIQDLATTIDAHLVSGQTEEELKKQIDALDKTSENHRIILDGHVNDIKQFSWSVGYELLELKTSILDEAVDMITTAEKEIPLTDECLSRVDPTTVGLMYDLMMKVDCILTEHNLTYWATCGTLLGAVRHQGIIPWDDDIDICMYMHDIPKLLSLKKVFNEHGLNITLVDYGYGFYKIYFIDGKKIQIKDSKTEFNYKDYHDWTFPFIDVYPVFLDQNKHITHVQSRLRAYGPNEYFLPYELIPPFTLLPFGPMYIPAPRNPKDIVKRMYGEDWNAITYCMYNHQCEHFVKKLKVALVDRSRAPYVMPIQK